MAELKGKRLVLGVTGGIAAYKAAELARLFVKSGADVQVVMTTAACGFVAPATMQALTTPVIERAIYPVGFYRTKAKQIQQICAQLRERYQGRVPDKIDELLTLPGVGRKTANLVVTVGYEKTGICVDIHVHRISNRWGYVKTKSPDETETALREKLPRKYWITFNDLLVPYGQHLCQPVSPLCSQCKIAAYCDRVGVTKSR